MKLSAVTIAVLTAMCSQGVLAEPDEAAALKLPTNSISIGITHVGDRSAKFGEYTGMTGKGPYLDANVNIRGGDAYSADDASAGTTRWSLTGTDLGLHSRSLTGSYADQGRWSLTATYDELRHSLSDSYQTPYTGQMGTNAFRLPAGVFPMAALGTVSTTNAQPGSNALSPALFNNMDIASGRHTFKLAGAMVVDRSTTLTFDYNHLTQNGAKLMGFGQSFTTGTPAVTGEAVAILPMPTSSRTDNVNLGVQWVGEKAHASAGYSGSFYRDNYQLVSFQTWLGASAFQSMPTAPDNSFNQINLSGGYAFTPRTRLTANLSRGRNTQDVPFVGADAGIMVTAAPRASLGGLVVTSHTDIKLTDQTLRNLALSAAWRQDERDNRTPSSLYNFNAIGSGHVVNYPNTPLSLKKSALELSGDYTLARSHHLRLSYSREDTDRWCNSYAVGGGYPAGTGCVVATAAKEDKLELGYRVKAADGLDFRFSLGENDRKTESNPLAIAAFEGKNGVVPGPVPATNTIPAGQNAGDYFGFYPFFDATRRQTLMKTSANWDLNEQLSLTGSLRYGADRYQDSTFGVQGGRTWAVNLDSTYAYAQKGTVSAYATHQHRQRSMTNAQRYNTTATAANAAGTAINVPATATWTNDLSDDDTTVGIALRQGGLASGKLSLAADLSYSVGKAAYSTVLNYAGATVGGSAPGATCANAALLSCGDLPAIRSAMTMLKLTGTYALDTRSRIVARLVHQRLNASDYIFNGYQLGSTPSSLLPTNQTTGSYRVNAIGVTYAYDF